MNEAHKKALAAGRERALKRKRKEAVKKVRAWAEWCRVDSEIWGRYLRGEITRDEWLAEKPQITEMPTDNDYALARSAGEIV